MNRNSFYTKSLGFRTALQSPRLYLPGFATACAIAALLVAMGTQQAQAQAWDGDTPATALKNLEVPDLSTSIYVSPKNGNDDSAGTDRDNPLRTIEAALERVQGGDTIILMPGTFYADTIRIANIPGASEERRLTLRAETPGTTTISAAWPGAAQGTVEWRDEGEGIYSAPDPARRGFQGEEGRGTPMTTAMGGYKDNLMLRFSTLEELREGKCLYNTDHSRKPAGSTFKTPGYGFAIEEGRFYVRLPDRTDPNGKRVVVGTSVGPTIHKAPDDDALLIIDNTPGLVLDGIRFEGAYVALGFQASSTHAVVRNCLFEWCHIGMNLPGDSVAEWNEFAYVGLRKLINECRELNGKFDGGEIFSFGYQPIWMFGSFMRHSGQAGNVDIRFNYIHEAWDGLWFGGFRNSSFHHNILEDCIDNAVEFDQAFAPNLHFHHNLILGAANGVISHQRTKGNNLGPHYIYRNVIVGYDDPGWNSWTLLKMRSKGRSEGFVFHHNLFWVGKSGLYWRTQGNANWLAATKSIDFRNNVIIAEEMGLAHGVPFPAGHNVIAGAAGEKPELQGTGGFYVQSIEKLGFRDPKNFDFTLTASSPLIDAGWAVPSSFLDKVKAETSRQGREHYLADVQQNTRGQAPDIGPFEFGQEMGPDWPRPRRTVFNVAPFGQPPSLEEFARE
jgi:hypothetical protein